MAQKCGPVSVSCWTCSTWDQSWAVWYLSLVSAKNWPKMWNDPLSKLKLIFNAKLAGDLAVDRSYPGSRTYRRKKSRRIWPPNRWRNFQTIKLFPGWTELPTAITMNDPWPSFPWIRGHSKRHWKRHHWQIVYKFLFVFHCNYCHVLCRFQDKPRYRSKIACFRAPST